MNNNSMLGILVFIIVIFIVVTLIRVLWPLVLVFVVYVIIRSFFMKKPNTTYHQPNREYTDTTQHQKQDSHVIDVEFEERELKDDEN